MKKFLPTALAVTFITGYALADNNTKTDSVDQQSARCAPYPDCVYNPELTQQPSEQERKSEPQKESKPVNP